MSYYADYSNYTDFHGVDEDMTTISDQGGCWAETNMAGITRRAIDNASTEGYDIVASGCCTIQKKNKHHSPSLEGE